jgi:glycosyltransferase involved in cell wall biosynthesis
VRCSFIFTDRLIDAPVRGYDRSLGSPPHRGSCIIAKKKILLISADEFSGVRPALMAALERAGCEVLYRRQTLRELGLFRYWHALRMIVSGRWVYGRATRVMMQRTRAAFDATSRVNTALVKQHAEVDTVILFNANSCYVPSIPSPRPQLVIYTDYANLLSKGLEDRGFDLYERKAYPLWNALERRALFMHDLVFVMGKHVKPAMETAYGMPSGKVTAVGAGPGLDVDIERDRGIKDPSNRTILFVGKLAGVKGLRVLLEAFAVVRSAFPDAILHVVTRRPVVAPGVIFHGKLSERELKELFYSCNVFTMPAFKEPLGLVFLEAMWSKCACIGTATGSMPEIIEEGITGYLVEPGDSAALADRLMALLADPDKTQSMGERGYAAARRYWNWDAVAERMLGEMAALPQRDSSEPARARATSKNRV